MSWLTPAWISADQMNSEWICRILSRFRMVMARCHKPQGGPLRGHGPLRFASKTINVSYKRFRVFAPDQRSFTFAIAEASPRKVVKVRFFEFNNGELWNRSPIELRRFIRHEGTQCLIYRSIAFLSWRMKP